MSEMIRLDAIKKGAQARARMKKETIEDYAHAMREGAQFPPIVVFRDGDDCWLADGFHRVEAARCAEREEIEADIKEGNRRDALLHACGANISHGLPRTNADKRKAVTLLLQDKEGHELSNREIARHCGVDEGLVRKIRDELSADCPQINPETRVVTRGGTTYKQQKPSKSKDAAPEPEGRVPSEPEPSVPTLAEDDGFAALQTAWRHANQNERKRFVAWARDNDASAFGDASAPAGDDTVRETDAPAIARALMPREDAIEAQGEAVHTEPTAPVPAPVVTVVDVLPSVEQVKNMGADQLRRLAYAHGLDSKMIERLNNPDLKNFMASYIAQAQETGRNAA